MQRQGPVVSSEAAGFFVWGFSRQSLPVRGVFFRKSAEYEKNAVTAVTASVL